MDRLAARVPIPSHESALWHTADFFAFTTSHKSDSGVSEEDEDADGTFVLVRLVILLIQLRWPDLTPKQQRKRPKRLSSIALDDTDTSLGSLEEPIVKEEPAQKKRRRECLSHGQTNNNNCDYSCSRACRPEPSLNLHRCHCTGNWYGIYVCQCARFAYCIL
jgi:hypothetical protein